MTEPDASRRLLSRLEAIPIEWTYVAAALVFGIMLALLTPPFQTYDENAHYQRAWSVAQGQLVAAHDGTVDLPENVASLPSEMRFFEVMMAEERYDPSLARTRLWDSISSRQRPTIASANSYSPIGYLPQALGIEVARLLGRSPLLGLYFGRLCSLFVCVALVFLGLRVLPVAKGLIAAVALFPLTVTLMASMSQDGLVIAGWLLFVCLVVRATQMEKLALWDIVLLAVVLVVFSFMKPGYALFALLVFVLRPSQLGGRRRYALFAGGMLAAAGVITLALTQFGPDPEHAEAVRLAVGLPAVDTADQLRWVIEHPRGFFGVLKKTYESMAVLYARQMVGVLAWGAIAVHDLAALMIAAITGILMLRDERAGMAPWQRLVLGAVALALFVAISVAMYITYTPSGQGYIDGIQGRYFLPLLPPALLAIYGLRIRRPSLATALVVLVAVVGVVSTVSLLLRYYY